MTAKRIFQSLMVIAILAASLVATGGASALSGCTGYVTAQAGDTLDAIAASCGVTVEAIQTANPGLVDPLAAGQMLYIPTGLNSTVVSPTSQTVAGTYVVQQGDTLSDIASKFGFSLSDILAANPQLTINPGQLINLPAAVNMQPSTNNFISMTFPFATTSPALNYPSSITDISQYSVLRVTYGQGLIVRTGPGTTNAEIHSLLVSAMGHTHWWYRKNSPTLDSTGMVCVEIQLPQPVNGSSVGWIMVKDMLGNYFTLPNIDPPVLVSKN